MPTPRARCWCVGRYDGTRTSAPLPSLTAGAWLIPIRFLFTFHSPFLSKKEGERFMSSFLPSGWIVEYKNDIFHGPKGHGVLCTPNFSTCLRATFDSDDVRVHSNHDEYIYKDAFNWFIVGGPQYLD